MIGRLPARLRCAATGPGVGRPLVITLGSAESHADLVPRTPGRNGLRPVSVRETICHHDQT